MLFIHGGYGGAATALVAKLPPEIIGILPPNESGSSLTAATPASPRTASALQHRRWPTTRRACSIISDADRAIIVGHRPAGRSRCNSR